MNVYRCLLVLSTTLSTAAVFAFRISPIMQWRRNCRTSDSLYSASNAIMTVALTREEGNNEKLRGELNKLFPDMDVSIVELPCIAHAEGEDLPRLEETLQQVSFDYIAVTSPEAARVMAPAYKKSKSTAAVAAVGQATRHVLEDMGIAVQFCPSKATAKTLVEELPSVRKDGPTTLLYPASARAATTLQEGLEASGVFAVTRLNTYDTTTAVWTEVQKDLASQVTVACFGSPSAVESWLLNSNQNRNVMAACIGETSAAACRKFDFPETSVFFPEKPGIPGWAQAVQEAILSLTEVHERNVSLLQ